MRGIRIALLEADVNFDVVGSLTGRIRERAVGEELSGGAQPGPAGDQDRAVRADRQPRRRTAQDHPRPETAHSRADGRPPGHGQDHQLRQTGPLVPTSRPQPDARGRRPAASRRGGTAPHAGRSSRGAGLQRTDRSGAGRLRCPSEGRPIGMRRGDSGHRRPSGHRRADDGSDEADIRCRRSTSHFLGGRRHDRPGRSDRSPGLSNRR